MTLLESFISNKIKSYIPPEKKRVVRGERIGYQQEKYHASLLLLKTYSLKEIAKIVNSPYGSLRNWKIEKRFCKLVDKHAEEFIKIYIESLVKRVNERNKEMEKILKKPFEKVTDLSTVKSDVKKRKDVENYSKYLSDKILVRVTVEYFKIVKYLLSKRGIEGNEITMVLETLLGGDDMGKHAAKDSLNKIFINYFKKGIKDFDVKVITILDELLTVSKILIDVKYTKAKHRNRYYEGELVSGSGLDYFNLVKTMPFFVQVLLHKKTNTEKYKRLTTLLLSRAAQNIE